MSKTMGKIFILLGLIAVALLVFKLMKAKKPIPFFGIHLAGFPLAENEIASELSRLDLAPDFIGYFQQWPAFPDRHEANATLQTLRAIAAQGSIPIITWEPMWIDNGKEHVVPAADILSGKWDLYLADFARSLSEFNQPVIIRFGHEMNLIRYHWGTTSENYANSPSLYRQIFRHVRNAVIANGGKKTYWMFCPNNQPLTGLNKAEQARWNNMAAWFPGKKHVDILGIDGYNWGTALKKETQGWSSSWQAPWDIFSDPLDELQQLAPELPVFIGETSCSPSDGNRALWINQLVDFLRQRQVRGIMWFHINKELPWSLTVAESLQITKSRQAPPQKNASDWLSSLKRTDFSN